jgi:hypothetical protein
LPCFSIEPNKCSSFNRIFWRAKLKKEYEKEQHEINGTEPAAEFKSKSKTIKRQFHNFEISENAYRTLKRKMSWLYYLAKPRHVVTYNGKDIFNFKMGFLTLTLPSKQRTPTAELTKNLFNQFLTEIRQKTKMQNYIWRLEFQKNGNAHYHIATDTYLDYFFVLKTWNRILSNAGYVEPYTMKHTGMSLSQYNSAYNPDGAIEFKTMANRYAKGCKHSWTQPPTVDVKSVISNRAIANYIAKYFSKDADSNSLCNELDTPENSKSLRLWFCSRSLSKLNSITNFCDAVEYDIFSVVKCCQKIKTVIFKYATVFYYDIQKLLPNSREFVEKLLHSYSHSTGYQPAGFT